MVGELKVQHRFCERDDSASPDGEALLLCDLSGDCTIAHAPCLAALDSSRSDGDGGAILAASLDNDRLADSAGRYTSQRIVPSILENKRDRLPKISSRFGARVSLTVRAWNLRAVGDEPFLVLLNDGRELVVHDDHILPR